LQVLITGHDRVRLTGAGVLDVLEADSKKPLADMQALSHALRISV
jgi:hypothetical protein